MKIETEEPILKATDSQNIPLPLDFFEDEWKKSQLFGKAPNSLIQVLKTKAVTYNGHLNGVLYSDFIRRDSLNKRYRLISTNEDRNGKTLLSTFDG